MYHLPLSISLGFWELLLSGNRGGGRRLGSLVPPVWFPCSLAESPGAGPELCSTNEAQ